MAQANVIAKVLSVSGEAYARGKSGASRRLHAGDFLREGEIVVTGAGAQVQLALDDGRRMVVGGNEKVLLDAEVASTLKPGVMDSALPEGGKSTNRIIQALKKGGSLDDELEEPAAGNLGESEELHSFVRLVRIVETIDPFGVRFVDGAGGGLLTTVAGDEIALAGDEELSDGDEVATTPEDTDLTGSVLIGTASANGAVTVMAFSVAGMAGSFAAGQTANIAGKGQLTIEADGDYTFKPAANYNGPVPVVTYTVTDGTSTDTSTLTITVTPVSDGPLLDADEVVSTPEDMELKGSVLTGTTSVDGPVTVTGYTVAGVTGTFAAGQTVNIAGKGQLTIEADGDYTFKPAANYNGPVPVVTYTVTDGTSTDTSTLTITVTSVDDPFTDADEVVSTPEDTEVTGSVLTGTTSIEGPVTVTGYSVAGLAGSFAAGQEVDIAGKGKLVIEADGDYRFTPAANYHGPVPVVTYTVSDGKNTDSSTLTITVTPANDPPVVNPASATVTVSEEGLAGGLADSTGNPSDTTNAVKASGQLTITDADNDPVTVTLSGPSGLTAGGVPVVWSGTGTAADPLIGTANGVEVCRATIGNDGKYEVTLSKAIDHPTGQGENLKSFDLTVTANDGHGGVGQGKLTVNVEDDAPVAADRTESLTVSGQDSNVMLILDLSGSMNDKLANGKTRLEMMKESVNALLDKYDGMGDVKVRIVTFGNGAQAQGSEWVDVATAKAQIDALSATPLDGTNYDAALQTAQAAYESNGKIAGAQNVSYFLSDGEPTLPNDWPNQSGIQAGQEAEWKTFLEANDINSMAYGMGPESKQGPMNPVAYNGATASDTNAVVVANMADLPDALAGSVVAPSSGTLMGANGGFGADGGHVASITVDGTTYSHGGAVSGTNRGTYDAATGQWTIQTTHGGKLVVDMDDGKYTYTPAASTAAGYTESIGYTLIDRDGDTASAKLNLEVGTAPVLRDENEVVSTPEDTVVTGNVLTALSGAQGPVTVTGYTVAGIAGSFAAGQEVDIAGKGKLVIEADGDYRFTPAANYHGPVPVVTYTVSDGKNTDSSTLTITVTPANDPPVVNPASATVTVSEEGLSGGLADSTGNPSDTTNAVKASGQLTITDADNDPVTVTLSGPSGLTAGGVPVVWSGTGTAADPLIGTANGVEVCRATIGNDGQYEVTLSKAIDHPTGQGENLKSFDLTVTAADGRGGVGQGKLTVNVEDDAPVAADRTESLTVSGQDTNVMLILDTSYSMAWDAGNGKTRLQMMKESVGALLDKYDGMGDVKVRIVTFSTDGKEVGSQWVDVATAKAMVNGLTEEQLGATNYDAALLAAQSAYASDGKIAGAQNVSYFLSDGEPTYAKDWDGNGPLPNQNGIQPGEAAKWQAFLEANQINSFAYGMGPESKQGPMNPVAYNGTTASDTDAVVVANVADLPQVLAGSVVAPSSGTLMGANGGFGADGGHVASITVDGTTYSHGGAVSGTNRGTYDAATGQWTIQTTHGGKLVVDMDDGKYVYTPAASTAAGYTESIGYTLIDRDGDTASAKLNLEVGTAPVLRDENEVVSTPEDTVVTGNVLTALSGAQGPVTVTGYSVAGLAGSFAAGQEVDIAGKGKLVIEADGDYRFTPAANYHGPVPVVTYTVSDGKNTDSSTLSITVTPANDPPVVNPASATVTVSEEGLAGGLADATGNPSDTTNAVKASGQLTITDTDNDPVTVTLSGPSGLTAGGVPVVWSGSGTAGDPLIGTANGVEVCRATIGNDGQYEVTLSKAIDHPTGQGENLKSFDLTVTANDGHGGVGQGKLTVNVEDDAPVAADRTESLTVSGQDTNVMLILDTSYSMAWDAGNGKTRLQMMKESVGALLDKYDGMGDVKVRIVTFSTDGKEVGSQWVDVATAKAMVNGLTEEQLGATNYDAALLAAQSAYASDGKIAGAQNVSYFLSDGEPTYAKDWDGNGPLPSQNGIQPGEAAKWQAFLEANQINSFAYGMGPDSKQSPMNPVAYNGTTASDTDAVVVANVADLPQVLAGSVVAPSSGTLMGGTGGFGADGGHVASITVDGTTYSHGGAVSGTNRGTYDAATHQWTLQTTHGGKLVVDMDDGKYVYTPAASTAAGYTESIGYTLIDRDGDTASAKLNLEVGTAPVLRDENEVVSTPEDTVVTGNVLTALSGAQGPVTVTGYTVAGIAGSFAAGQEVDIAGKGKLVIEADGDYTFTPAANYHGPVPVVTYTVSDGKNTDSSTLTITVTPANDPPVVNPASATVTVSEEGLSGGLADSTGNPSDTTNAVKASGQLTITDADNDPVTVTLSGPSGLTAGGVPVVWSGSGTAGDPLIGTANGVEVCRATIGNDGQYEVTLSKAIDHPTGQGENLKSFDLTVTANDGRGGVGQGKLTVNVEDDAPVASGRTDPLNPGNQDTNVMLVLDTSYSMAGVDSGTCESRMELMKDSVYQLLAQYEAMGDVRVRIVTFSDDANANPGGWMTVAEAKAYVKGLQPETLAPTNYDAALLEAQSAYASDGKIAGAQNVSYFLSDGEPTYAQDWDGNGPLPNQNGIQPGEEAVWTKFLSDNHINSFAYGMGADSKQAPMDPIAYDGINGVNTNAVVVADMNQLPSALASSVVPTSHGYLMSSGDGFGADGGNVASITVDGTTYRVDGTVTGTSHGSYDATTHVWTVQTSHGGKLLVDMDDSRYSYTPAAGSYKESIGYTVIDHDGDTASATLMLDVSMKQNVTLVSTTTDITCTNFGLSGEYFGYNDNRNGSQGDPRYEGLISPVRLHSDDGKADAGAADNIDRLADVEAIIEGRNNDTTLVGSGRLSNALKADATFSANKLDFGFQDGTDTPLFGNSLGTNGKVGFGAISATDWSGNANNLHTFLKVASGNADHLVATAGLGRTTDAAIRMVGYVYIPVGGAYELRITGDDGYRVLIGGKNVAEVDQTQSATVNVYSGVALSEGLQPIEILYWDQGGHAGLRVEVKPAGAADSEYKVMGTDEFALFSRNEVPTLGANQDIIETADGQWAVRTGQTYNGSAGSDNVFGSDGRDTINAGAGDDTVKGGGAADSLAGGQGNDLLTGGLGADTFVWHLGDQGSAAVPAVDTVTDFDLAARTSGGDALNLKDLLQNENSGNLTEYLHFSKDAGGNTVIDVKHEGAGGAVTQQIVLTGVDLTNNGAFNDQQIIQDMLNKGKLITD